MTFALNAVVYFPIVLGFYSSKVSILVRLITYPSVNMPLTNSISNAQNRILVMSYAWASHESMECIHGHAGGVDRILYSCEKDSSQKSDY